METAIVSLISIALIVLGGMTMSQGFLTSVDTTSIALEELGQRDEAIMRTELSLTDNTSTENAGEYLIVQLTNSGQTKLASFSQWDIIVQYYDTDSVYQVKWLPYAEPGMTLGANQWQVTGIYLDGNPEVFEPNILNSGEKLRIKARLDPPAKTLTTGLVVISTPNGVATSGTFSVSP